jgi:hypothetical protein
LSYHSYVADAINDALEASTDVEISDRLLNVEKLKAHLEFRNLPVPYGKSMSSLLSKAGFQLLGRFRVNPGGENTRYYTREPDFFPKGGELEAIRALVHANDEPDPFA